MLFGSKTKIHTSKSISFYRITEKNHEANIPEKIIPGFKA